MLLSQFLSAVSSVSSDKLPARCAASLRRNLPLAVTLTVALWAGTFAVAVMLAGCGGGHGGTSSTAGQSANGRALVTVRWPALTTATTATKATRLVPEAANLVVLSFYRTVNGATKLVGKGQAVRPASSTTSQIEVDNLPIDTLTAVAIAYPGTDPAKGGTPVAQGSVPVTTLDGQLIQFNLTMESTIDHITLSPAKPTVALGATQALTATAYNGPDETTAAVVMLTPSQLQWSSSDATLASVDGNGLVTALLGGHPTIQVQDLESLKTASTTVTVPLVVTITPAAATLSVTDSTALTATVAGAADTSVTWSIVEASGGTVSASGVYTAPARPGKYTVVATSVADPTYKTSVTVTIQAATALGTIN